MAENQQNQQNQQNSENNADKKPQQPQQPQQPSARFGTLHSDTPAPTMRTNEYSNPSQTRSGTAKMKFAPKIQPRKKPAEVKQVGISVSST